MIAEVFFIYHVDHGAGLTHVQAPCKECRMRKNCMLMSWTPNLVLAVVVLVYFQCSMCVWCWPSLIFILYSGHIQCKQVLVVASSKKLWHPQRSCCILRAIAMASASASSNQPMEPQPKARAQTGEIKIIAVGSWTKAWNLAGAEGDVTKLFHVAVTNFIIDSDESSLHKRWMDHHGMRNTKWHEQLRKLELGQSLFHILVPTGKTKH